jgi:hypothetical protein
MKMHSHMMRQIKADWEAQAATIPDIAAGADQIPVLRARISEISERLTGIETILRDYMPTRGHK